MKLLLLACAVLSCTVSLVTAAPPTSDDAKKKKETKAAKVDERKLLEKYDTDSDRKLDKTELGMALRSLKRNIVSTKNDSWKKFDTDADEKIELRELKALIEANAEPEVDPKQAEAEAKEKEKDKKPSNGLTLRPPGTP